MGVLGVNYVRYRFDNHYLNHGGEARLSVTEAVNFQACE